MFVKTSENGQIRAFIRSTVNYTSKQGNGPKSPENRQNGAIVRAARFVAFVEPQRAHVTALDFVEFLKGNFIRAKQGNRGRNLRAANTSTDQKKTPNVCGVEG